MFCCIGNVDILSITVSALSITVSAVLQILYLSDFIMKAFNNCYDYISDRRMKSKAKGIGKVEACRKAERSWTFLGPSTK